MRSHGTPMPASRLESSPAARDVRYSGVKPSAIELEPEAPAIATKTAERFAYPEETVSSSGDDLFAPQAIEEIEEGCASLLIESEPEKAALRHVVHALQLTP
jgi:hypothetical protein